MKTKIFCVLCLLLALCMTEVKAQSNTNASQTRHEVQMGETLYSISQKYGVSIDAILAANPKIGDTLMAGSVITIPSSTADNQSVTTSADVQTTPTSTSVSTLCKTMHEVKKKETVFSIAHQYHISEEALLRANPQIMDNKIRKGEILCIPYTQNELAEMQRESEAYAENRRRVEAEEAAQRAEEERRAQLYDKINVAVVLPFSLSSEKKTKETVKIYDFYEGFLLAVDEMKRRGISIEVTTYEEPTTLSDEMGTITADIKKRGANLIIGPMRQENITALARLSRENSIPIAVPFSSRAAIVASSPFCFQVNTAASTFYHDVYDIFVQRYSNHEIIIVNIGDKGDQTTYIQGLKERIEKAGLTYKTIELDELKNMSEVRQSDRRCLIVPTSNTQAAIEKVLSRLNQNESLATLPIDMFGFPEWQTYSDSNKQALRRLNAAFFCTFYADPTSTDVLQFNRNFQSWFKRSPMPTYPHYGLLGYDIGRFFISGLNEYGRGFCASASTWRTNSLQNPMHFEQQSSTSSFVNSYFRIITL